jgi:hypothetical protein
MHGYNWYDEGFVGRVFVFFLVAVSLITLKRILTVAWRLYQMRAADARFDYLWSLADADVTSTRGLVQLTQIVSWTVAFGGLFPNWRGLMFGTRATPGWVYLIDAVDIVFTRLTFGLSVCAALCVVCLCFEHLLRRRQARWRYVQSTASRS